MNVSINVKIPKEMHEKMQKLKKNHGINWSFHLKKIIEEKIKEIEDNKTENN